MPIALETFVKQLSDSGIIAPATLENFVPPKAEVKDALELARRLVDSKQLTKYQVQEISAGRAKSLILGNYTLLDPLGAGGMGQVFRAEHRRMKRLVALKILPKSMTQNPAAVARFAREVEAAAKLSHPNIVAAYDADEAGGVHFLVMQYVEGVDLAALVKQSGPLPWPEALDSIAQAARGLVYAHGEGVIHRDIKPANLLLDKSGVVKILDMGLARIESSGDAETQAQLTADGAVMGTIDYMAPEQALGAKHADARSDIYSLGCTLYYLLSGKGAYGGDTLMSKLVAHREEPIPALGALPGHAPAMLDAIFRKMVAKKPEERYPTMAEALHAIEALQASSPEAAASPDGNPLRASGMSETVALSGASASTKPPDSGAPAIASIAKVVASEKSKYFLEKILGGAFVTIIAPLLVVYLVKYLDSKDPPPPAPALAANNVTPGSTSASDPAAKSSPAPAVAAQANAMSTPSGTNPPGANASATAAPANAASKPAEKKPHFVGPPGFDAWAQSVAREPPPKQVEMVSKRLQELNPGFEGRGTFYYYGGAVAQYSIRTDVLRDISPVRAFTKLKVLRCIGSAIGAGKLVDLAPLEGMPLSILLCYNNPELRDLAPLSSMSNLQTLDVSNTQVASVAPLASLPLTNLYCSFTQVSDLAPLRDTKLVCLACDHTPVRRLAPLSSVKTLEIVAAQDTLIPSDGVNKLKRVLPHCRIEWPTDGVFTDSDDAPRPTLAFRDPAFDDWLKQVADPTLNRKLDAVMAKLHQLNPGFDRYRTYTHDNGALTTLAIRIDYVTDLSPLLALPTLKVLHLHGGHPCRGQLTDLAPLAALDLTDLYIEGTRVADLSPLANCKNLTTLWLKDTKAGPATIAQLKKALPKLMVHRGDNMKHFGPGGRAGAQHDE